LASAKDMIMKGAVNYSDL